MTKESVQSTVDTEIKSTVVDIKVDNKVYRFDNKLFLPMLPEFNGLATYFIPEIFAEFISNGEHLNQTIQATEFDFTVKVEYSPEQLENYYSLKFYKDNLPFNVEDKTRAYVPFTTSTFEGVYKANGYLPLFSEIKENDLMYLKVKGYKVHTNAASWLPVMITRVFAFDIEAIIEDIDRYFQFSTNSNVSFNNRLKSLKNMLSQFYSEKHLAHIDEIDSSFRDQIIIPYLKDNYSRIVKEYVGTQILKKVPEHTQRNILVEMSDLRVQLNETDSIEEKERLNLKLSEVTSKWKPISTMRTASSQHLETLSTMSFDDMFSNLEDLHSILNSLVDVIDPNTLMLFTETPNKASVNSIIS